VIKSQILEDMVWYSYS